MVKALLMPEALQAQAGITVDPADTQAAIDAIGAFYAENWWAFLLVAIAQVMGTIALLVLLTDHARPTVGEALQRGATGFLTYLGAQLLFVFALGLLIGIPIALAALTESSALIVSVVLLAVVVVIYCGVKISLVGPVIAIDGILNPVAVLARSWRLTKGNSFRLALFYFLLVVAIGVVSIIVTLLSGVIFAVVGGEVETIGNGVVTSLVNAVFAVIFLSVLAAIHRQLAGPTARQVSETFE